MKHAIDIDYETGKGVIIKDLRCPYETHLKDMRSKLVDKITGHDNPFRGGGSIKFTLDHSESLEKWFNELWRVLEDTTQ